MIFSISSTMDRFLRRQLAYVLLVFGILAVGAGGSWAGYSPEGSISDKGGGSWGSVLRLSVQLQGDMARFTVSKKDGLPFSTEYNVSIKKESLGGQNVATGWIQCGLREAVLTAPVDEATSFYAYVSNSYGHAWVGPVQPTLARIDDSKSRHFVSSEGIGAPKISEHPASATVGTQVDVRVTASTCRDGSVQVQCFADGSNHERSNPYLSRLLWQGETIAVPFVFRTEGTRSIACVAKASCCSSEPARRTIRIHSSNRPPAAPRISARPADAQVGVPVVIPILAGSDPDDDAVKVQCRTQDDRAYQDVARLGSSQPVEAIFHFLSPGSKRIACRTVDDKKAKSAVASRSILIHEKRGRGQSATKINISVLAGPDGTDSRVSIESSGGDCAPFCDENGEITYGKPYVPSEYSTYSEQHDARRIVNPTQFEESAFSNGVDDGSWQQHDERQFQPSMP